MVDDKTRTIADMIADRVIGAVADVLGMPADHVALDDRQDATPGWDSIAHIEIIEAVEDATGTRLTLQQQTESRSVAKLIEAVGERING